MFRKFYSALMIVMLGFGFFACRNNETVTEETPNLVSQHSHDVISRWNNVFLEIERYAAGYRPGPAPRANGLLGLATYEACISGMPAYNSLENLYPGLEIPNPDPNFDYFWPEVVNSVQAYLMKRFFATVDTRHSSKIAALENYLESEYAKTVSRDVLDRSKSYGDLVAAAVWEWSKSDIYGHDAYFDPFKNYSWQENFDGPGDWVPTIPGPGHPMFPHWGKVRVFAISETDKLCPPPLPYSESPTSPFYAQALEVYAQSGVNQTYEGKWIGEFWSDDLLNVTFSPGPRWIAVANQVYENEEVNLETAIFANAKVGMALHDAAVACWHSKFYYNVERPESYIQRVIDPTYDTPLNNPSNGDKGVSPSFPAYPSGHSTMGAAGAEALSSVFGYNYSMTDRCHEGRTEFVGTPRTFNSFYEMAEENAWSRVPLGVHYRMDCEFGVNLGYRCARKVNNLPWLK